MAGVVVGLEKLVEKKKSILAFALLTRWLQIYPVFIQFVRFIEVFIDPHPITSRLVLMMKV